MDGQESSLSLPSSFLKLHVGRMELLAPDLKLLAERVELPARDLNGHTHFLERHSSSMDRQSRTTAGRSGTGAGRSRKRFRCSRNVTRLSERRVRWQKRCGVDFRCRTVPIPSLPLRRERLLRRSGVAPCRLAREQRQVDLVPRHRARDARRGGHGRKKNRRAPVEGRHPPRRERERQRPRE